MTVLIYGGSGALGRQLVNAFNAKGHVTVSVDLFRNDAAGINIIMSKELDTMTLQAAWIKQQLVANGVEQLDALICVAGGWAGGNAAAADTLHNAELMIKQSVYSSFVAAHVAAEYVKEGGFVLLTGALAAAQGGTAYMIGYGAAKAAVHQLTKSLAAPSSGLKEGVRVAAILPAAMPQADTSTWTPLDTLANQLLAWTEGSQVQNGALYSVVTSNGETAFTPLE